MWGWSLIARRSLVAAIWLAACVVAGRAARAAETPPDPAALVERTMAEAEAFLRDGETQLAESRYRDGLLDGWLLLGSLAAAEQRWPEARSAFEAAAGAAVEARSASTALALVHLREGRPAEAATLLRRALARHGGGLEERRLLARVLVAEGRPQEAVQELEEAHASAPDDLEMAYTLATGYLGVGKPEAAAPLFDRLVEQRPIPQTHVLIGRTYRDFRQFERARAALGKALELDPKARRARYYLGTVDLLEEATLRLDEAMAHFRAELALAPEDPLVNLFLGMALAAARRCEEALPRLETAKGLEPPSSEAFHFLGRCLMDVGRAPEAVPALERALELAQPRWDENELGSLHYQLAQALKRSGRADEAAVQFAAAERMMERHAQTSRERLADYLAGRVTRQVKTESQVPSLEASPLEALSPERRRALRARVATAIARACFNLGIVHAQAARPAQAASFLARAAEADPAFPGVQRALGIALFQAAEYGKAVPPLERAVAEAPADGEARRLLALACFNAESWTRAAELLGQDPGRTSDASLEYAYAVALVKSGDVGGAEGVFARLLATHGGSPELAVVMGQAQAQQGDFEAAERSLRRALERKPDVAEAHATLGQLYLRQGRLPEAETELRAELTGRPRDAQSRHALATVLDLLGRPEEALAEVRVVLGERPDHADARYLSGKVLLSQGRPQEAVEQLEAAARLAPEDANVRYQLAQAYRRLGRAALAERELELYRKLKDKRRGGTS
jgi:tetratricopeptide (TPR) repeat protein